MLAREKVSAGPVNSSAAIRSNTINPTVFGIIAVLPRCSASDGEGPLGGAYFSMLGEALQRAIALYLKCAFSTQRIASRTSSAAVVRPSFSFARTQ